MTKGQALYAFWASFGWTAIDEESAYDENVMETLGNPDRYISFESAVGQLDETPISLSASLWDRSTSWSTIEQKAAQIYDAIGTGGVKVNYDGGQLWITRNNPFSKRGPTIQDYDMRRILININAEFLSA